MYLTSVFSFDSLRPLAQSSPFFKPLSPPRRRRTSDWFKLTFNLAWTGQSGCQCTSFLTRLVQQKMSFYLTDMENVTTQLLCQSQSDLVSPQLYLRQKENVTGQGKLSNFSPFLQSKILYLGRSLEACIPHWITIHHFFLLAHGPVTKLYMQPYRKQCNH